MLPSFIYLIVTKQKQLFSPTDFSYICILNHILYTSTNIMRISLLQDNIYWADKDANFRCIETHLSAIKNETDLVVLPEMFSTGFCTDQPELAEDMCGLTVTILQRWAQQYNIAITGSFIAESDNKLYNRAFFVFPNGDIRHADKRHLFSIGGENNHFEPGNKKLLVNYAGFNILILVCYDIRFPVWSRNINNEYDLIIYVANFPERRINNWDILLKARAIENQSYVCGVNRIGTDDLNIKYNGHSVLLDFFANTIVECPENRSEVATAKLDLTKLHEFRRKSPFWKDADQFKIIQ